MSVVWLATHRTSGEPVALKTVRAPDEVYLSSLRREIHALSRLRHPGVVRIVAEGLTAGVPWYAMELLVGETLADVHAKLWSRVPSDPSVDRTTVKVARTRADEETPIAPTVAAIAAGGHLQRALTLVRRLCTPLAFLHGEGIVHCDLKPHNIFVRPGDLPVLVDFGLAWRAAGVVGREVAEVVTKVAGTPAYMAPEQIRLEGIDPRTDLYALGCVLYELVTGQPPFVGGHDVLVAHLTRKPTEPSRLVAGVPPALDTLILGLLAKNPRDRIGYAEDVIVALEKLGAEPEPGSLTPRARPWLYRPGLSGRDRVMQELLTAVERPKVGTGSCVLIGGESGIGKTFLATEVARRAGSELKVVASACAPRGSLRAGSELLPFQELFGAIADRCTSLGIEATDRILGARGKVLAPYAPRLARLPGVADQPDPPDLTGAAARELLFVALRDTLAAFAREEPLLLLLDDLQWADELGLEFLATLPDGWLSEHPVAILATYRSEERPPPLTTILARADVRSVLIGRLDEGNVREVVRDMLAIDRPPDGFVRFLARQSEGNPFFVAEYLRTAVADGVLKRASFARISLGQSDDLSSRVFEHLPVPRTIRELVARRFLALSEPARALVDVACVIGRGFDSATLQATARASDGATMEGLAELLAREVIEPLEGGRFQFVHDKLREVAYGALPEERRNAVHLAVASAFAASLRDHRDPDALAAVIAHHFCCAHDDENALVWLERAGQRALRHAAYREAIEHFRQAIDLAAHRPARVRARLLAAAARAAFGAGDATLTDLHAQRALAMLDAPLPETNASWLLLLGRQLATQATHLAGVVRGRAHTEDDRSALRDAATIAGVMTHRYFYSDDAVAMLTTSLLSVNLAERASAETAVSRPYTMIGFVAGMLGAERLARSYFARARAGATNDPIEHAFALTVEGVHDSGRGSWHTAEQAMRRAESLLEGVHDPVMTELTLTAHGHLEFYSGRVLDAERRFEELLRSARVRGSEQHETWAQFSIARSLVARDRCADALPLLESAQRALARRPELQSEIICHGLLATVYSRLRMPDRALVAADATAHRIERARPTGFPALEGYRGAIEAYLALGELRRARRIVRALASFARVFPIGRPSLEYFRGELARASGKSERAMKFYENARKEGAARAMPREEAEARVALSRY